MGLEVLTVPGQLTRAASDRHECDLCTAPVVRLSIEFEQIHADYLGLSRDCSAQRDCVFFLGSSHRARTLILTNLLAFLGALSFAGNFRQCLELEGGEEAIDGLWVRWCYAAGEHLP